MAIEFEIALENLYKAFSKYPLNSRIEGCPCCVSGADKATLHSKALRNLEDDDLSKYAFKAMTTFGDVSDFKHFLPRILELLSRDKLSVDTFVMLGKLKYGNWDSWPKPEQAAIKRFLREWWNLYINQHNSGYFEAEILIEINKLLGDLAWMLSIWNLDIESVGFVKFVELIKFDHKNISRSKGRFKEFPALDSDVLKKWIAANSAKLEDGFNFYEIKDIEIAVDIATALENLRSQ